MGQAESKQANRAGKREPDGIKTLIVILSEAKDPEDVSFVNAVPEYFIDALEVLPPSNENAASPKSLMLHL